MREPALAAAGLLLLGGGLAACAPAPGPTPGGAERDLARYRTLPHYRAFAASPGAFGSAGGYASGWASAASWIDGPIEVALSECERRRDPSTQPACALHAIGDIVVAGADAERLGRAKCVYILDPAAASVDGPAGAKCAAVAGGGLFPAAGTGGPAAGDPAAGVVLSVDEINSQLIGNTLARKESAYVHLRADGAAILRSADPVVGPDTGSWRFDEQGRYCAWWGRVGRDREVCGPVTRRGDGTYEFAGSEFAVIGGNPFGL